MYKRNPTKKQINVMLVITAIVYGVCLWSISPAYHQPGLDGSVHNCKNSYHTHHK